VLQVSGRGYPVEIRYRPINDPDDPRAEERDQLQAISDAVVELSAEPRGDILVFLSGEREIRDTADALARMSSPDTEILPLYARLSAAEQHRVFAAHQHRRIVLATNVAETSLTVPGIRYVIDAGTARISRYSNRTKVQLLPIEPVSQASAQQRSGRCGRTADGICIRLYSEEDYESRPAFTDPEILRTNLAAVILQMAWLDLGPIEEFGFIDAPDRRQIGDGLALLTELGALTETRGRSPRLTPVGRRLAQLPIDPRLGRMVLEADRRGCLRDVLVLAAALSIQDPRERPAEHQQAADASHARFVAPGSDFSGYLRLWQYVREQQKELSSNQFRRMCRSEFLSYLRIREWQDLFGQLRQTVKGLGIAVGDSTADPEQVHRSVLAGLLSQVGARDPARNDYLGARGARFAVFPGSGLARKPPAFVMAAELVETSRLWARVVASIQPEWVEELATDLVRRSYSEPHWERRRGSAVALERVTLYGVPLVAGRTVALGPIDPELSRDLFIRHALVERDWATRHTFFRRNGEQLAQAREMEERARRRDLVVDDETVYAFYDQRIPETVVSARHFDRWWRDARRSDPQLLDMTTAQLLRHDEQIDEEQYPTRWTSGDFSLDLRYRFSPGASDDGVTVAVPVAVLGRVDSAGLDWQVPGLRLELVTSLLRNLPKEFRRQLVPVPDTARALLTELPASVTGADELVDVLGDLLAGKGVPIPRRAWNFDGLPPHLRPTYRVIDDTGRLVGEGKDLDELQRRFAPAVAATLTEATADVRRDRVPDWDFDELPRQVKRTVGGYAVTGYPALVDNGDGTVGISVLSTETAQLASMWAGTRRLLATTLSSPARQLRAGLDQRSRLLLSRSPHGSLESLLDDCVLAAVDLLMRQAGAPVWTRRGYEAMREQIADSLAAQAHRVVAVVTEVLSLVHEIEVQLQGAANSSASSASSAASATSAASAVSADEREHLVRLVHPGFVTATESDQLVHLPRYLAAVLQRLADAPHNRARDAERQAQVAAVRAELVDLAAELGTPVRDTPALRVIYWMIEELRVSLFAQRLGTPYPVSVKRIRAAMDSVEPG
jgi:ATP-dependent helicase HrpA